MGRLRQGVEEMLNMERVHRIRTLYHHQGESIRGIARKEGLSRNTVRKVLRTEGDWRYSRGSPVGEPIIGPYREIIDSWLEGDRERRKKERHTARRIYSRLVQEHGYGGSERTVRRYVSKRKREIYPKETFLTLEHDPGGEMEGDFMKATMICEGKEVSLDVFLQVLPYSGAVYAKAHLRQNRESLLDGLVSSYHFFGGVGRVQVLDNTREVVKKVLKGRDRDLDARYLELLAYYAVTWRFCNRGKGNEKPAVENTVQYLRNNFFVPLREVSSLETLNKDLEAFCREHLTGEPSGLKRQEVARRYVEEAPMLLPLPSVRFDCGTRVCTRVSKMARVIFRGHRYSVPDRYTGFPCLVKGYPDRVEVYVGSACVASHRRRYGEGEDALDPLHYVNTLRKKPGAFYHSKVIRQWRAEWSDLYETLYKELQELPDLREEKEMIEILALEQDYPRKAIEEAVHYGVHKIGIVHAAGIRRILEEWTNLRNSVPTKAVILDHYNHLIPKGGADADITAE